MTTISIRLPDALHRQLSAMVEDEGLSIEQFASAAIAEKVAAVLSDGYIESRAARGSRARFDRALVNVPAIQPDPGDELAAGP